ncbi:hypothetical protein AAG570_006323 [Ranatra chinensis]|uniref:Uncharacterized protein n=1 Tax=Ranatra chinensis TaxID=642074 RepID=A0ABD0YTR5_9HEMI
MHHRGWVLPKNKKAIKRVDKECKEALEHFNTEPAPYLDFLQRFRWTVSASYYMCWYTLQRYPVLSAFGEPCDNLANCFDFERPKGNQDPRANDSLPFACAMYR